MINQGSFEVLLLLIQLNKTLRLHPPVLFGSQRVTPPEDLQIRHVYIPGQMVVYMPTWQLHHDARNFPRPDEFVPERRTERSEMVLNQSAFLPFLIGKFCFLNDPLEA